MLRKLNKDELILLIQKINENHKKEIEFFKEEKHIIKTTLKEFNMAIDKCCGKNCKALSIRQGGINRNKEVVVNCQEMQYCIHCSKYICEKHFNDCPCFQK